MLKKDWKSLKFWQKAIIIDLILIQIGLFLAAWTDLSRRPEDKINGRKQAWRAALFLNGIGPLAYLLKGRQTSHWTEVDVPPVVDKVAVVTGANSGIGFETTRVLAQRGATVVMACRDLQKAEAAAAKINALNPVGKVDIMQLDLADLDSVRHFATKFQEKYDRLDLLINNAGIMVPPTLGRTQQGFEMQFGVNHLGHFLLTSQLIDMLNHTPGARIVTISSNAHRFGKINFDDLNWQQREFKSFPAYAQSKLANLLFTYELNRRLKNAGHETFAVAAHPGFAATGDLGSREKTQTWSDLFLQPQKMGALPTLYAATAVDVQGGRYYGPSSLGEMRGYPEEVTSNKRSHNLADANHLWSLSESMTEPFVIPSKE